MKLQNCIHYYIGCRCVNAWFPEGHEMYANGWILTGYRSKSVKPYELENDEDTTCTDSIKLILRRLEDMTDEDIKEFIGWESLNEKYVLVSFERCINGVVVYYSIDAGEEHGGLFPQTHKITFHSFSPNELVFLISKGFDLLSLIKNGLAIDSKTLK